MNGYIDFAVTGRVLLYALIAGVGIVGAFSLGARSLARAEGAREAARSAVLEFSIAAVCFAIAAAGVVIGVWFTLDK